MRSILNWNLKVLVLSVGFQGEGKTGVPGEKKRLEQKRESATNLTTPGFEPWSPCWKASALTTALPLLPNAENYMQL